MKKRNATWGETAKQGNKRRRLPWQAMIAGRLFFFFFKKHFLHLLLRRCVRRFFRGTVNIFPRAVEIFFGAVHTPFKDSFSKVFSESVH